VVVGANGLLYSNGKSFTTSQESSLQSIICRRVSFGLLWFRRRGLSCILWLSNFIRRGSYLFIKMNHIVWC
jgi:hypothetical protein